MKVKILLRNVGNVKPVYDVSDIKLLSEQRKDIFIYILGKREKLLRALYTSWEAGKAC